MGILKSMKKDESEARILILGLDNSGKTTILKKMSDEDITNVLPTQGFNVKSVSQDGCKLTVWDIGGQQSFRPYWRNYFESSDALVYIVDSSDLRRLEESSEELQKLIKEDTLAGIPFLIFANKQDLLQSMSADTIAEKLALAEIQDRTWSIHAASAKTGDGLTEGMEWLIGQCNSRS